MPDEEPPKEPPREDWQLTERELEDLGRQLKTSNDNRAGQKLHANDNKKRRRGRSR